MKDKGQYPPPPIYSPTSTSKKTENIHDGKAKNKDKKSVSLQDNHSDEEKEKLKKSVYSRFKFARVRDSLTTQVL